MREHRTTEEILQELKERSKVGLLRRYIDKKTSESEESTNEQTDNRKKQSSDIDDLLSSIFDD